MMRKILAAKFLALILFWHTWMSQPIQAVMAVVDKSNLAQNIISAAQSVTAVEKQIQRICLISTVRNALVSALLNVAI